MVFFYASHMDASRQSARWKDAAVKGRIVAMTVELWQTF